jgi:lipopolysaccharide biosynthesis regulator YciM
LDAYYAQALALKHENKIDAAIETMKKVIYIDRDNVLGHLSLADLYHDHGQWPQALKSLDNVRCLLEGRAGEQVIPDADGITVERLREAIRRRQQRWCWSAEAGEP